ncbi:YigZ family protein [Streptomyces cirratus]
MKADQYVTVAREGVHEAEINRSRFLCSLAPAATEQEAQEFIARIRKEHPTATHTLLRLRDRAADASIQKASDDGEPGGTAGVPMLQMLTRARRPVRRRPVVTRPTTAGVKLGPRAGYQGLRRVVAKHWTRRAPSPRAATGWPRHRRPQRAGKTQNDLRSTGRTVVDLRYGSAVEIEVASLEADLPAFEAWLARQHRGQRHPSTLGGETYAP